MYACAKPVLWRHVHSEHTKYTNIMSCMKSMKLVIAYMLLFWHYFCHSVYVIICQFCLIGEYRIQTYLSSDFFPQ